MHNNTSKGPLQAIAAAPGSSVGGRPLRQDTAVGVSASVLSLVLDEIDHGALLLADGLRIVYANAVAQRELGRADFIHGAAGVLDAIDADANEKVLGAAERARQGERSMLTLHSRQRNFSLVFLPFTEALVLVQTSRLPPSDNQAIVMFARSQDLSPTEESVMLALCKGWEVPDIAKAHRVAESTIRSQIKSIREKTGNHSIRRLLQWLHSLPPVVKKFTSSANLKENEQVRNQKSCHEQPLRTPFSD